MAALRKVIYVGNDLGFWEDLIKRSEAIYKEDSPFEYEKVGDINKDGYRSIFMKLLEMLPKLVYIDFSDGSSTELIELATRINDEPLFKGMIVVGILGDKELEKDRKYQHIGLTSLHIKCAEMNDTLFLPFSRAFPGIVKVPSYARAKFQHDCELGINMRIAYVAKNTLHIENNIEWDEGDRIELETKIPRRILPSKQFTVVKRYISNLQFRFLYAYDLKPQFLDPPEFEDDDNEYDRKSKLAEYQADVGRIQKEFKSWVFDKSDLYSGKQTKVLVVDTRQDIFREDFKLLSEYNFTFFSQTHLSDDLDEIGRLRPNLIAIQLDDELLKEEGQGSEERLAETGLVKKAKSDEDVIVNNVELITAIMKKLRSFTNYEPAIVLFNSGKYSSKACQDNFKYSFVLSNSGPLNLNLIAEFAEMYEKKKEGKFNKAIDGKIQVLKKKEPGKYRKLSRADFVETKFFLKFDNNYSNCVWKLKIRVESMTESEVVCVSEVPLLDNMYSMDFPQDIHLSLVPVSKKGEMFEKRGSQAMYRGIINYVDEVEKRKLRQFVNGVFFSDLNKQREQEQEAYEQRHEAAAAEKTLQVGVDDLESEESEDEES